MILIYLGLAWGVIDSLVAGDLHRSSLTAHASPDRLEAWTQYRLLLTLSLKNQRTLHVSTFSSKATCTSLCLPCRCTPPPISVFEPPVRTYVRMRKLPISRFLMSYCLPLSWLITYSLPSSSRYFCFRCVWWRLLLRPWLRALAVRRLFTICTCSDG